MKVTPSVDTAIVPALMPNAPILVGGSFTAPRWRRHWHKAAQPYRAPFRLAQCSRLHSKAAEMQSGLSLANTWRIDFKLLRFRARLFATHQTAQSGLSSLEKSFARGCRWRDSNASRRIIQPRMSSTRQSAAACVSAHGGSSSSC
jgi:hypothetical protein